MSQHALKTYLLTYRKRTGLSQHEVAFLLGIESGTTVSKHETGARTPHLDAALSYAIILGPSAEELFAGRHRELQRRIQGRAAKLMRRLKSRIASPANSQKLGAVTRLLNGSQHS